MEKIPTAEEFLEDNLSNPTKGWSEKKRLIEFAKLYVEAALKEASEKALVEDKDGDLSDIIGYEDGFVNISVKVNKDSILNSYPLENIK